MSRQTIAWNNKKPCKLSFCRAFAVRTRLELATSAVTGRHSNQLNYRTNNLLIFQISFGGPDGTRTRDLRRDRAAF